VLPGFFQRHVRLKMVADVVWTSLMLKHTRCTMQSNIRVTNVHMTLRDRADIPPTRLPCIDNCERPPERLVGQKDSHA
jgi:hypothetical protein